MKVGRDSRGEDARGKREAESNRGRLEEKRWEEGRNGGREDGWTSQFCSRHGCAPESAHIFIN